MKTDPRLWLSPPLKPVVSEIPNSVHIRWNDACHNYYLCGWKLGYLKGLIHSKFHPSQRESFWLRSRFETSETTWSALKPYRELHEISHSLSLCTILRSWAVEASSSYSAPRAISLILRLKSAEVSSSEFCIEVLIWGNKDLDLLIQAVDRILMRYNCWQALLSNSIQSEFKGKPLIPSAFVMSSSQDLLSDPETLVRTPSDRFK